MLQLRLLQLTPRLPSLLLPVSLIFKFVPFPGDDNNISFSAFAPVAPAIARYAPPPTLAQVGVAPVAAAPMMAAPAYAPALAAAPAYAPGVALAAPRMVPAYSPFATSALFIGANKAK